MSAPKRISDGRITEAIAASHGNVTHAAEALGMARKNLYERMAGMGILPSTSRPGPRLPVRIPPEQAELLRQASFDLQAKRRTEMTGSDVLAEFIAEAFGPWLESKLGGPR